MSRLAAEQPGLSVEVNPVIAYSDGYSVADLRGWSEAQQDPPAAAKYNNVCT